MNFAVVRRNMSATRCALLILAASIIFDGSTAKECSTLECPDTFVWNPRCGSDGKTYGNDCEVKMAQCLNPDLVEIHDGPCTNIKRSVKRSTPLEFQCHPNMKLGFCTNEYNPVCGNDGKTYPNHCCLCAAKYNGSDNLKVISRGPCNVKQLQDKSYLNPGCSEQVLKIQCTQDEFPLCGTDGKTYGNACKFCKGLYALKAKGTQLNVAHLGQCKPKLECPPEHLLDACPLVFQPICADDGNTYTNLCRLCAKMYKTGKRLKYLHEGLCQRPAHDEIQMECRPYETEGFCTNKYVPVCGSNGKTYGNKCTLCHAMVEDRNLKLDHFGVCDSKEVEVTTTEVTRIECNQTEKICSQEYSPVCASDGTTLHNKCAFCSYKFSREKDGVQVDFKHTGECKPQEYCIPMSMFGACPYTYFPVCATDGNTYPNLCVMCAEMYRQRKNGNSNFVLRKVYDGICGFEPPMYYEEGFCNEYLKAGVCSTWEYSPYCGSDGQTYANKCQFCQEMYKQKQNGEILNVRIEGECPENFKCGSESLLGACPYTYLPVCGSNGVTYSNDCLRCAEMHRRQEKGENIFIYVKYKGECPK